jgi:hypothetical protein
VYAKSPSSHFSHKQIHQNIQREREREREEHTYIYTHVHATIESGEGKLIAINDMVGPVFDVHVHRHYIDFQNFVAQFVRNSRKRWCCKVNH